MIAKPIFILISGKKGHGKNFCAKHLHELLMVKFPNLKVVETSFARPIKDFCASVFGFSHDDMETEDGKKKLSHLKWSDINKQIAVDNNKLDISKTKERSISLEDFTILGKASDEYMTIREVLQIIGTDVWRKRFYDPIWSQAAFMKKYDADIVIITDCRFKNEIAEGAKYNAINIRVSRQAAPLSNDKHQSEIDLDDYPWKQEEILINQENNVLSIYEWGANILCPKIAERTI